MKALRDPQRLLSDSLAAIRTQFRVVEGFPAPVEEEARLAAARVPDEHVDRTALPFVTLDPASSTDLDQAFTIERAGADLLLRYAIADVGWFVRDGDPLDIEAWRRGETLYLPDGKASLYPTVLSQGAASLLPDRPRPAVILAVRVSPDGAARLDGAERALIRSRAKLAYETAGAADLPEGFGELARRIAAAEDARGAARIDPPEQEVTHGANGALALQLRPGSQAEVDNAGLSLAAHLAVAQAMLCAGTGLFRVMDAPDAAAERRLRASATAFGIDWPSEMPLADLQRRLDAKTPRDAAFMLAIRRAGHGASYAAFHAGDRQPWHAAMAATYAHATAPLRRLADRYVLRAVLAIGQGDPIPAEVTAAFDRLPKVMAGAEQRDGQIDRAVIAGAEVALLGDRIGEDFAAVVIDCRDDATGRIQLADLPVVASIKAPGVAPGAAIRVRLLAADPIERRLTFATVD